MFYGLYKSGVQSGNSIWNKLSEVPVYLLHLLNYMNLSLPDMELKAWPSVKLFPTYVIFWGTPQVRYVQLCFLCTNSATDVTFVSFLGWKTLE